MSSHSDGPVSPPSFTEPVPPIGNPSSNPLTWPSLPNDSPSGTTLHGPYEAQEVKNITRILWEKREDVLAQDKSNVHAITINTLPDDVLLEVFDSCRKNLNWFHDIPVWGWIGLALVCQRWRQIILESPCRLEPQILCNYGTPLRENLDFWPPFPIAIQYIYYRDFTLYHKDNLFAALEHPGRICSVDLHLKSRDLRGVPTVMQEPFPELTHLSLRNKHRRPSVITLSDGFLGGSAPGLLYMFLEGIIYPALPALLSSTSGLVHLELRDIPEDGHISPEIIVACLGALPRLELLCITTKWALSNPDQILQPPETRTLLPALTSFEIQDAGEYLEDLISRIDGPQVKRINVNYLEQPFDFQIVNFIDRSENPEITLLRHANVTIAYTSVIFMMYRSLTTRYHVNDFIRCRWIGGQILRVAQVFSQHSAVLSRVVHLEFDLFMYNEDRRVDEWLLLIRQFSAVRTLRVSRTIAGEVALALQDITGEMIAEVLPVLEFMYLENQPLSSVEKFLTTRRLSGHPVTTVDTEAEFNDRVKSYASQ